MKQVIRLTESQLKNIIKTVISEQASLGPVSGVTPGNRSNPSTSQPDTGGPESTGGPSLGNYGARNNSPQQDIIYVQKGLIRQNYGLGKNGPDGRFGSATKAAVIAFQKNKGLPATGVVDQATAEALGVLPLIKTLPVKQNVFPKPVASPSKPSPAPPVDFKFDKSNSDSSIQNRQGTNPVQPPSTQNNEPDYRKRQGNY
jgi:peptidoglycan hydrolase-like protein with peptidoglycan-binding domain